MQLIVITSILYDILNLILGKYAIYKKNILFIIDVLHL